jgi:hypothetical protein
MQGEITKYRDDLGIGVIRTAGGGRYRFARQQIRSSIDLLLIGQEVDFVLRAGRPTDIIITSASPWLAFMGCDRQE